MTSKELPIPPRAALLSGVTRRALSAVLACRDRRASTAPDRAAALRERLDYMEAARTAAERARLRW